MKKQLIFLLEWYIINKLFAEMAERLNAHDSKSCYAGMYTRVQIPFSAPKKNAEKIQLFVPILRFLLLFRAILPF